MAIKKRGDTRFGQVEQRVGTGAQNRGGNVLFTYQTLNFTLQLNAANITQAFYLCGDLSGVEVIDVREVHAVLGTDGGAVTIDVTKDTGTTAPGAGTSVLLTPFDAKSTVNTPVAASLAASLATRQLAQGDRLSLKYTGTITALAGVVISVRIKKLPR